MCIAQIRLLTGQGDINFFFRNPLFHFCDFQNCPAFFNRIRKQGLNLIYLLTKCRALLLRQILHGFHHFLNRPFFTKIQHTQLLQLGKVLTCFDLGKTFFFDTR